MANTTDSSLRPTVKVTPDSRFATTFLSTKYRDRAVNGEAMMDKTTGELFIKRPTDGKVISFYQNKKMINDFVSDMFLLLVNNTGFKYPSDDEESFCVSTNYDLVAINNEFLYNILKDNITISGTPNDINKLVFNVSGGSNGFFCRSATRDVDKVFVEYLTNIYNITFKNSADATNEIYLEEYNKFITNDKWEMSNASIVYDLICIKDNHTYTFTNIVDYIRLNDDNCIIFPDSIYKTVASYDMITVIIKSINYDKLHFMINNKELFNADFIEAYNKLIHVDNRIEVAEFNITHFIDNANDLMILGNETIVSFLDIQHINKKLYEEDATIDTIEELRDRIKSVENNVESNSKSITIIDERVTVLENVIEDSGDGFTLEISDNQPTSECLWFKPKSAE